MRIFNALLVVLLFAVPMPGAAARPNVVLIISDDQGWMDFGFMGSKAVATPNLDRLADQSAVFVNGYVPTSLCRPSLASIMTGLYPSQHKITSNDFPADKDRSQSQALITKVPTFPRLLAQSGYNCLQTGKFWEGHFSHGGFTHGMTEKGRHGDEGLAIGRKTMQPIYDFVDESVAAHKPFFVWYAPMMPHTPHNPPKRILDKYVGKVESPNVAAYYAMCEWMDETVGQLLDFLQQRELADNTMILFVVDNGWIQNPAKKDQFDVRSKRSPYDAGLRTPIIISYPSHTKSGRYEDLATSLDLAPTILAACGVATPGEMSGINLLDRAGGGARLSRDTLFGEIFTHDGANIDNPQASLTHSWMRQGDWKLIVPAANVQAKPELYNVARDPMEQTNLAADNPDVIDRLRARLGQWSSEVQTLHPMPTSLNSVPISK
jgi:uncharacterized sulfatase